MYLPVSLLFPPGPRQAKDQVGQSDHMPPDIATQRIVESAVHPP